MVGDAAIQPAPEEPPAVRRRAARFDALAAWLAAEPRTVEAQDAAHAAVLRCADAGAAPPSPEPAGLVAWLRLRVFAELRRRRRRRAAEAARRRALAAALAAPVDPFDPAAAALAREAAAEFRAEVRALPPDERTAFVARHLRGEPAAETATALFGAADTEAVRAVARLAGAALTRLRVALERRFGSPEAAWDALWVALRHLGPMLGGKDDDGRPRPPESR